MQNKLIIFDIDGTLTNTNHADSACFEKAILDTFSIPSIDTNWYNYKYSTDLGIVTEIVQSELNRAPTQNEIETVRDKFVKYLEATFEKNNTLCVPIEGSQNIFEKVSSLGWDIGIATGAWEKSAVLKLKTAQIEYRDTPIAHSDDHFEREKIISIAINRAERLYKKISYEKIIYVGDRLWDRRAAKNLEIDFIGVGDDLSTENNKDYFHIFDYTQNQLENYLINAT